MGRKSCRARNLNVAPLAGRGRRLAPGEGGSPRTYLLESLLGQPLTPVRTPTLSPQARGEGAS
jgi:hypothetical protein